MNFRFLLVIFLFVVASTAPSSARQNGEPLRRWTIQPVFDESPQPVPVLFPHKELQKPKVALVLSGGGARGMAAIGVLEAFERMDVPIDFITGTSIGSIVGGLYASGYSVGDLKMIVDTTDWEGILSLSQEARRQDMFYDRKLAEDKSLLVLRFDDFVPVLPEAFSTGQRLMNYLNVLSLQSAYHPDPMFDNLRIPFRAIATDLVSGKRVVLDRGDLSEALRSSVTVPLLFSTFKKDSTQLLDGGLTSNIPADIAREWGADIVVVVDLTSPLRPASELTAPWEIADQIIGIVMQLANKEQLKFADFVIRPEIGNHLSTDFSGLDSLIDIGRHSAEKVIPAIKTMVAMLREDAGSEIDEPPFVNPRIVYDVEQLDEEYVRDVAELAGKDTIRSCDVKRLLTDLYATGNFERTEVDVEEYPDRTVLRLNVARNPLLQDVQLRGNSVISSDTLKLLFSDVIGRRLNFKDSHELVQKFLEAYRQRGYSLAAIRSIIFDRSLGILTIEIDEGVVYRRTIVGTTKTKDYVIWRELPWRQGEVFNIQEASQGLDNLNGTNLFEQVSMTVVREGEQQHQVVVINARERHTDLIRLGLLIDNERNVQPSIDIRDENFLGIASELGLHFFGGFRNRYFFGEFKANRIFDSYFTFNLRGYYGLRDVNVFKEEPIPNPTRWNRVREGEYREIREGASVSFGTQLERLGLSLIEIRNESQRIWSISGQVVSPQSFHVTAVKIGAQLDTRDRFPYPNDGVVMDFFYESGLVKAADRMGYTKMYFSYDSYKTIFDRQLLHPSFVLGFGDETVPVTELFSLGGQESFFGYREDNARGRQLLKLSLEYRYLLPVRLLFDTYVKIRYDVGHIWEKAEQLRLKDMRHGIGATLGLDTPIGPAEFSVGRAFFIRKDLFDSPLSYGPIVAYFRVGYAF